MAVTPIKRHRSSFSRPCIVSLRVELEGVEPLIWRRIVVDGRISLAKLHHIIQAAMGWSDAHMHLFEIRDHRFGVPDPEFDSPEFPVEDERKAFINRLVEPDEEFIYRYDMGDDWRHRIVAESFDNEIDEADGVAYVAAGENACPPEDVGGPPGYQDFLDMLEYNPGTEEAQELLNWAGSDFDPKRFDRHAANAAISRMLWSRRMK